MSKIIKLDEYKDRLFISQKYKEFRDLSSHLSLKIEEMRAFVERNGLQTVKSNHRVDKEIARLCLLEIEKSRLQVESLLEGIDIVESTADVLEFKAVKKKAA